MIRLVKFDNKTTYMYPNGEIATPERIKNDFPAIEYFTHVLEINGDVCQAVMNLKAMRNMYNIDESLSDDEAIQAIEEIINTPPPIPEPTPEERIASALEFQNLMMM